MVLSSQSSRPQNSRRHMASRRKRSSLTPWAIGVAILLAAGGGYYFFRDGKTSSPAASTASVSKPLPTASAEKPQPVKPAPSALTPASPVASATAPKPAATTPDPAPALKPAAPVAAPVTAAKPSLTEAAPTSKPTTPAAGGAASGEYLKAVTPASPAPGNPPAPTLALGGSTTTPSTPVAPTVPAPAPAPAPGALPAAGTSAVKPGPAASTTPAAVTSPGAAAVAATSPAAAASALPSTPTTGEAATLLAKGMQLLDSGEHIEARTVLSKLLTTPGLTLSSSDAQMARQSLASVNAELIFSPNVDPKDPLVEKHVVQPGESYTRIAGPAKVTAKLLEIVNRTPPTKLQAGKAIKVIRGPFHAVVDKSDFRMDLYLTAPDGSKQYIRSFNVGLGSEGSTPVGTWIVRTGSKVTNPSWKSPRDQRFYESNDPQNPIGEHWIGLQGTDDKTKALEAYGIHGTVDPSSIGQQKSMGCIRLLAADVELVYHLLVEGQSTVIVQP